MIMGKSTKFSVSVALAYKVTDEYGLWKSVLDYMTWCPCEVAKKFVVGAAQITISHWLYRNCLHSSTGNVKIAKI